MLPDKINPACGEAPSLFVDDLSRLRELFAHLEGELPPWRISYRQICGAPLEAEFMSHGWTSHLSVWDSAGSVEHKVDIFSKPPRVRSEEMSLDPQGWASQHVVALMKRRIATRTGRSSMAWASSSGNII